MKAPYISCQVKQDAYTTTNRVILPHELQLLSLRWGKENIFNIEPTGQERDILDFDHEYNRLMRDYGRGDDRHNNRYWVEIVFGHQHEDKIQSAVVKGAKHFAKAVKIAQDAIADTAAKAAAVVAAKAAATAPAAAPAA